MNDPIDEQAFVALGYAAGRAFASMLDAFMQGFTDQCAANGQAPELVNESKPEPELKTRIQDCRACWCDGCALLEHCEKGRDGAMPDGISPLPCIGCVDGTRFRLKEQEPCPEYAPIDVLNHG